MRLVVISLLVVLGVLAAVPVLAEDYPRPDLQRDAWKSLDGKWSFAFDDKDDGLGERWFDGHRYDREINVPYPYQAKLSGIGDTTHHKVVWYSRKFTAPADFDGKRVRLHIGAADYAVTVWVNGQEAGKDEGGYVPYCIDITPFLRDGGNELTIRVFDDAYDPAQPRGKQHPSGGLLRWHYTHITGLWQPVWLEAVSSVHIDGFKIYPRIEPRGTDLSVRVNGDGVVKATALRDGKRVASAEATVSAGAAEIKLSMPGAELWSPENPALYDLELELYSDGQVVDKVRSYFGVRTISIDGSNILLNGKPVWLNMALVQGYWPTGLYVPPSPEDYRKDVEWCKELGLNGIRMHQKVEDPRFLYWCDKLGLLVWGEMANAGEGHFSERAVKIADTVWERTIERDFNHPCIITWTYDNEHWMHQKYDAEEAMVYAKAHKLLKKLDPTRPVIDNSGYLHVSTDIYDFHGGSVKDVVAWVKGAPRTDKLGPVMIGAPLAYEGQPIVKSEWGCADFDMATESYYNNYEKQVREMASSGVFCGQCYVQLNDIENECNGYMKYDRTWKVEPKRIAKIHAEATALFEESMKNSRVP